MKTLRNVNFLFSSDVLGSLASSDSEVTFKGIISFYMPDSLEIGLAHRKVCNYTEQHKHIQIMYRHL